MFEYLLVLLLTVWFVASVVVQLNVWEGAPPAVHRIVRGIHTLDVLGAVPSWNFFAPNPGTTDYHLLYRDRLDSGEISDWREAPIDKESTLLKAIWNPGKRKSKVLADVIGIVTQAVTAARLRAWEQAVEELKPAFSADTAPGPDDADDPALEPVRDRAVELFKQDIQWLKTSIPYLIILNYISHIPHPVFSSATQFLFAESRTYDRSARPRVMYMSELHDLP